MRQYLEFMRHVRDHGSRHDRPHRHALRVRLPEADQAAGRLPGAPQIRHIH